MSSPSGPSCGWLAVFILAKVDEPLGFAYRVARWTASSAKVIAVPEILQTLQQIIGLLLTLLAEVVQYVLVWSLLIVWIAWWLCGVNWKKTWPVLGQGAWVPLLLLAVTGAMVWSQLAPGNCSCLGFMTVPNFWWQLGSVGLLVAVTLFCGWLQGLLEWTPAEIELEPPIPATHDHGHH